MCVVHSSIYNEQKTQYNEHPFRKMFTWLSIFIDKNYIRV